MTHNFLPLCPFGPGTSQIDAAHSPEHFYIKFGPDRGVKALQKSKIDFLWYFNVKTRGAAGRKLFFGGALWRGVLAMKKRIFRWGPRWEIGFRFLFRGLFLFPSSVFLFLLPFLSLFLFFSGVAFFEFPIGFARNLSAI